MSKSGLATAPPLDDAARRSLMERVERAHAAHSLPVRPGAAPLPAGTADGPLLSSEMRHDLQHEGIVEQLRGGGLLSRELTVVDFGAGDGGLCRSVAGAAGGGSFVLVDRSRRPTMPATGIDVSWLCADVSALSAVELERAAADGQCVVVSNHLCGEGLDLAVERSVEAFHATAATAAAAAAAAATVTAVAPRRLLGVMAATCCHDQCRWGSFLGQRALAEWGFGARDFELLCQWSRMAPRRGKADDGRERVVREAQRLGVTPTEAAQLGLHCRRLMDSARLQRLRHLGFEVALVEHVDFRVTADNVMISAILAPTTSTTTTTTAAHHAPPSTQPPPHVPPRAELGVVR